MLLRFFNTAVARLLLSLGIVAALGMVATDRLLYRTSIDAVVNAPRIEVVAPTEGMITALPRLPGVIVPSGAVVAELHRTSWSQGVADEIGLRVAQQRARTAAAHSQLAALHTLRVELQARVARHRASSMAQLADEERALAASAQEHRQAYTRLRALHAAQSATRAELETANAAAVRSASAVARIREVRRAVAMGIVTEQLGGGAQDVPYSQQRVDDLTIQIARITAEQAVASAELQSLERELAGSPPTTTIGAAPAGTVDSAGSIDVASHGDVPGTIMLTNRSGGVVWSVPHAVGSIVMKGAVVATLVNCEDVFLEARISARDEASIRPGQRVTFHFAGERTQRQGTVAYVRGGGVRDDLQTIARLASETRASTDGRVVIAPDRQGLDAAAANSCHVGRSAKVTFSRRSAMPGWVAAR